METTSEQKGLDALIAPGTLTLGQIARLERIESPLLSADFNSLVENLKALYAITLPAKEFAASLGELEARAMEWGDSLPKEEYRKRLTALADGLVEFGILMPRPDEEAKKKDASATVG